MNAGSPGEKDTAEPTSALPSTPISWMQVLPSASTHLPPWQSVAKLGQSVLSLQVRQTWSSIVDESCPPSWLESWLTRKPFSVASATSHWKLDPDSLSLRSS